MQPTIAVAAFAVLGAVGALSVDKPGQCSTRDIVNRALLQQKVVSLGVPCEDMCKSMGAYPNCQCPGFEGQPASSDDSRACFAKNCQDPNSPCPNDAFVTCVKELTMVSTLQWDAVFQQLNHGLDSLLQTVRQSKALTQVPRPAA